MAIDLSNGMNRFAMTATYPTVLIVEDEPIIRLYEAELAEVAGFNTLEAHDANAALARLNGPDPIDILLTDVKMPGGVDGLELVGIVKERWPHIRIVVVSSHVDSTLPTDFSDITYLRKPFTERELVDALLGAA